MPASIEGATPANTGLCAFAMGTKTRKKEKNTHFRNRFITQGGKTSLPPHQTPRRIVILSVDLGLGRPKSAGTSRTGTRHWRTWETRTHILIHTTEKKLLTAKGSGGVDGRKRPSVYVHFGRNIPVLRMCSSNRGPNS